MNKTVAEIVEIINAWQNAGFVHPLTCIVSKHGNLYPDIRNDKVILRCPKCKYIQEKIPPSILEVTPKMIEDEKERLIKMGFQFTYNTNK